MQGRKKTQKNEIKAGGKKKKSFVKKKQHGNMVPEKKGTSGK